jgi:hypothetical protein
MVYVVAPKVGSWISRFEFPLLTLKYNSRLFALVVTRLAADVTPH